MTVIIVEHNLVYQKELCSLIESLGHDIIYRTQKLNEGINLMIKRKPHVAIISLPFKAMMRGRKNWNTLNLLDTPIVFLTVKSSKEEYESIKRIKHFALLSKPITAYELEQTMKLLTSHRTNGRLHPTNLPDSSIDAFVYLRQGDSFYRQMVKNILFIRSQGNYLLVTTDKQTIRIRKTLQGFSRELPKSQFAQVHRSVILNLSMVDEVLWSEGIVKVGSTTLPFSRKGRKILKDRLTFI